jgi:Staphylococcal nuclease homologue
MHPGGYNQSNYPFLTSNSSIPIPVPTKTTIVSLNIDDAKKKDKYGRTLAVVYVANINLNQELLKRSYAEVM